MANLQFPQFPQFSFGDSSDQTNVGPRWEKWLGRLENFFVAFDIKDDTRKRAMLLHFAGESVSDIFNTLSDTGEEKDYKKAKDSLTKYFLPTKNTEFEVYKFRQARQSDSETLDIFVTRLRQLAKYCQFADIDKEIKSQIVQGCSSAKLRKTVLKDSSLTLTKILDIGRTNEFCDKEAHEIGAKYSTEVKTIKHRNIARNKSPSLIRDNVREKNGKLSSGISQTCFKCGFAFPHKGPCPANNEKCFSCGKMNHFARMCNSKHKENERNGQQTGRRVNHVKPTSSVLLDNTETESETSGDDSHESTSHSAQDEDVSYTFPVFSVTKESPGPHVTLKINQCNIQFLIDTGAKVNVVDEATYNRMTPKPRLTKSKIKLFGYGKHRLFLEGKFVGEVETTNKFSLETFYVIRGDSGCLLGYDSAVALDLLTVTINQSFPMSETQKLIEKHSNLFTGIGKLKNYQAKLHIDDTVQPIAQPHRRIPFHLRQKVKRELRSLDQAGIIEKVKTGSSPTPWVSPIVVTPKLNQPDDVRICVDMRQPNKAIKRERHITPTIDDIIHDINGAKVFSKLDLNKGYHQIELHPDSRYITTFTTHVGLYRYTRLSFGINSAAELFQNVVSQVLSGLPNVLNVSDDILVFGKTQKDHDDDDDECPISPEVNGYDAQRKTYPRRNRQPPDRYTP